MRTSECRREAAGGTSSTRHGVCMWATSDASRHSQHPSQCAAVLCTPVCAAACDHQHSSGRFVTGRAGVMSTACVQSEQQQEGTPASRALCNSGAGWSLAAQQAKITAVRCRPACVRVWGCVLHTQGRGRPLRSPHVIPSAYDVSMHSSPTAAAALHPFQASKVPACCPVGIGINA